MKMLKNKSSVVTLLLVAVIVWGIIIYRLIEFSNGGPVVVPVKGSNRIISSTKGDSLLLNYRDPFLGSVSREKVKEFPASREKAIVEEPEVPPSFRFAGKIKKEKQDFLLIVSGGETRLISTRDKMIEDFRIEKIYADSLQVSKGKKSYTIRME